MQCRKTQKTELIETENRMVVARSRVLEMWEMGKGGQKYKIPFTR